jgi:hypothetical protein
LSIEAAQASIWQINGKASAIEQIYVLGNPNHHLGTIHPSSLALFPRDMAGTTKP